MQRAKKIIRRTVPRKSLKLIESGFRKSRGVFWRVRYGFPAQGMRVIAVTGTNGKSTTCSFINEVLKSAGYKTAVLTTVYYEIDGQVTPNKTHYTIDKQSIVQSFFARAKKTGVDFVILEVTSHALDQNRIMGVPVEIAVITNLTQEHLDYHKTMDEYARVKSLLLRNYGAKWAILNADDSWYEYFKERSLAKVFSVGKRPSSSAVLGSIKLSSDGSSAILKTDDASLNLNTKMIGGFNLLDAALAASVGLVLNLDEKKISKGIENLKGVSGRMEEIDEGQKFKVFIDYAVTADAIEQVLMSLQMITKGSVRIVFGATGDRDRAKRPHMGEVAAKNADFIYLTDDETYTESPESIRGGVYSGIKKAGETKKTKVIPDRKEAIKTAFSEAKPNDVILLSGLGHEDSRNMGGKLVPWNEKQIAQQLLTKIK